MNTLETLAYERDQQKVYRMGRNHSTIADRLNAERALRYFSYVALRILNGKQIEKASGKTNKTLEHLSSLKEFNGYMETCRRAIVAKLFTALIVEYPKNDSSWKHFIHIHWHLIWAFAKEFGKDKDWLTQVNYRKISAILTGRNYVCLWWWRFVLGELVRPIRRFIKRELLKRLAAERNRARDQWESWMRGVPLKAA